MKTTYHRTAAAGFTFIEALITIAILGVMGALAISAFSNASTDTNRIVSRQQQAALQAAVNAWVNSDSNRVDVIDATTGHSKMRTLSEIQSDYNGRLTTLARVNLIGGYLDSTTLAEMTDPSLNANTNKIKTKALTIAQQHLELPDWGSNAGDYPQVSLVDSP